MTDLPGVPHSPPFKLTHDPLAQVICQIRFSPILRLRQREAVIPFHENLGSEYPRYSEQKAVSLLITPSGTTQQDNPDLLHRFQDRDARYTIILAPDFVALETRKFDTIDQFATRVARAATAVATIYSPAEATRFGLRFINELRLPLRGLEEEMVRAIAPDVLGIVGMADLAQVVQSAQQVIELRGSGHRIVTRHGLFRTGGTTVDRAAEDSPPLGEAKPFYLLDFDVFTDEPRPFSPDGIDDLLRSFNDQARSLFSYAVNEDYRATVLGQQALPA